MKTYIQSDELIHLLSQVIAKANRTYVPPKEDDSHTNLYYDNVYGRLVGRWQNSNEKKYLVALNIRMLEFEIIDEHLRVIETVKVLDSDIERIENDIAGCLGSYGFNTNELLQPMHYKIPGYGLQESRFQHPGAESVKAWSDIRSLANRVCNDLNGILQSEQEVRIWPHHFDTGVYHRLSEDFGLGFGLAMKDEMAGEPYFYMTGYSEGDKIDYSELPDTESGRWIISEDWKGYVLGIGSILDNKPDEYSAQIEDYLRTGLEFFL